MFLCCERKWYPGNKLSLHEAYIQIRVNTGGGGERKTKEASQHSKLVTYNTKLFKVAFMI